MELSPFHLLQLQDDSFMNKIKKSAIAQFALYIEKGKGKTIRKWGECNGENIY
jgi:hypothetical protein